MSKSEALELIDRHKNALTDPVEMLHWTWLRVIINRIPEIDWEIYLMEAGEIMSR